MDAEFKMKDKLEEEKEEKEEEKKFLPFHLEAMSFHRLDCCKCYNKCKMVVLVRENWQRIRLT